ncbi:SixA phosphatase family protein [Microbacterium atlanticum]|uniref:SixA phosphatase family protein n=1 Tax=Microbacterium atlanticum TaxID=2782168 RepID=UPI0018875174|nr:histidine phosphatase family protein [Microbacterium atlanticum]
MITLALVRHAKSDWGDPELDDHERPLNDRGRRDAPRMARALADTGFRPEIILSSSAVRARSTARAFAEALDVRVSVDPELYGAPAGVLLTRAAGSRGRSVLVVAHDPGMSVLAARLSGDAIGHMPTCAVATFRWYADDWDVATSLDPDEWTFDSPR